MPLQQPSFSTKSAPELTFNKSHTDVTLTVQTSARVEEFAPAQAIDLGFAELPLTRGGVDAEAFCQAPLVLAVSHDHPLAARPQITPAYLDGELLIARGLAASDSSIRSRRRAPRRPRSGPCPVTTLDPLRGGRAASDAGWPPFR
ncbi:LysR substrate-binding domain-containing protein [Methylorubrum thiocyanatum]|uniref:LysR substrate-binding domain-containing protein n=1 Tax=Methylorubrum thiocyanatum TaxID=47958 RepID=UPI00383A2BCB